MIHFVETDSLRTAFSTGGPFSDTPVFLLHGWPDASAAWEQVAVRLYDVGYRTIGPWLRGFFPTSPL
jgi:pimeloyl-ACP methyl ester carboxylesterase